MKRVVGCVGVISLLVTVLSASVSRAQTAPTVNGLFYGDGDTLNYYLLAEEIDGRGSLYYNLVGDTLYIAMVVDATVNDNVFGTKTLDDSYMLSANWSAIHFADRLIGSDNMEFVL
ncbi:MAG: hypothetical protein JSV84_01980, partial [Gemmatimonadota bacterium]